MQGVNFSPLIGALRSPWQAADALSPGESFLPNQRAKVKVGHESYLDRRRPLTRLVGPSSDAHRLVESFFYVQINICAAMSGLFGFI